MLQFDAENDDVKRQFMHAESLGQHGQGGWQTQQRQTQQQQQAAPMHPGGCLVAGAGGGPTGPWPMHQQLPLYRPHGSVGANSIAAAANALALAQQQQASQQALAMQYAAEYSCGGGHVQKGGSGGGAQAAAAAAVHHRAAMAAQHAGALHEPAVGYGSHLVATEC
jgi:hypothetical protein